MMTFHDFLEKIRPVVNASALEELANLPKNTLGKHYAGAQLCHQKHFPAIVRALCAVFGTIEIDGWRIRCDGPGIFTARAIPDRETKVYELKDEFEYWQPEWRQVYDDFDFSTGFFLP